MAPKDEHLALSSGIGLAGMAVSNFWDYGITAFDVFKDEIIDCIMKPNKMTAVHWYLYFYQDIEEELHKLWGSLEPEWIYDFIQRTLDEVNLHPDLPKADFDSCKDEECAHYDCKVGEIVKEWTAYINKNQREINELIVHSAFQFVFQDRNFLHDFHLELTDFVEGHMDYIKEKYPDWVTEKQRIRRQYFPTWLTSAVFYRDKGTCSNADCRCDLSNLIRTQNKIHLDHIVPLDLYGSNDASNFQLLCETCNTSKGARSTATSSVNVPFWNL
ncbi:HNH endonuclease [Priestia megaterium]|uniref:HNH endonuclease n=1 Tax=Priestia megaterium TaxID=1404 RepID=UPI003007F3DE